MHYFEISYVTTLPKDGNAPRLTINGTTHKKYRVIFSENVNNREYILSSGICETNQTIISNARQWYTNWVIRVYDGDELVFFDLFNPKDKTIFIKIDAFALGDNIAWLPYVEEFRRKHNCHVICSTFYNELFSKAYPLLMFVKPNTTIENIYSQYYIGASNDGNKIYSPINSNEHPLQFVASRILGLADIELKPELNNVFRFGNNKLYDKYVTLSEFGSSDIKEWKAEGGWQSVVNTLNDYGYKVIVISKEPTNLVGVIDDTGDKSLLDRCRTMLHADFHLGVSSGLSWLAWGLGKHVFMISDVTPPWHEFISDITRLGGEELTSVNYSVETQTKKEKAIEKLIEILY